MSDRARAAALRVGHRRLRPDRAASAPRRSGRDELVASLRRRPAARRARSPPSSAGRRAGRSTSCSRRRLDVVIVACRTTGSPSTPAGPSRPARTSSSRSPPGSASRDVGADRGRGRERRPAGQGRLQPSLPSRASRARSPRRGPGDSARCCTCARATGTAAGSATSTSGARSRAVSGGGELVDQGMHLLDLSYASARAAAARSGAPAHGVLADGGRGQRGDRPRRARRRPLGDVPRELDGVEEPLLARDLLPHGEAPGRRARGLVRPAAAHHLRDEARARAARRRDDRVPAGRRLVEPGVARVRRTRSGPDDGRPLAGDLESAAYGWRCVEAAYSGRDARAADVRTAAAPAASGRGPRRRPRDAAGRRRTRHAEGARARRRRAVRLPPAATARRARAPARRALRRPPGRADRTRRSATGGASGSTSSTRSTGPSPSGTAGALRRALPLLGERFSSRTAMPICASTTRRSSAPSRPRAGPAS